MATYLISIFLILAIGISSATDTVGQTARPGPNTTTTPPVHRITTIKSLLKAQGYWISKVDSVKNDEYQSAITAFRKVHGLKHQKNFDDAQLNVLRSSQRPVPRKPILVYSKQDTERAHIEVDLRKQVLFVVDSLGVISHILPISSGNGKEFSTKRDDGTEWRRKAKTPTGQFRITRKIKGWRKSDLGVLYYPMYYYGGAALHGAPSVPTYPASHGCIRMPMFAAAQLSAMIPVGYPIYVF